MSETLLLQYQASDEAPQDLYEVTGLELSDGTRLRGVMYDSAKVEAEMTLGWPDDMVQGVAEFYDRHLTKPDPTNVREGWNCHSFVAATMGWEVYWDHLGFPYFMPRKFRPVDPSQLQDQQPYANSSWGDGFRHSFMGLPDPACNLGVWGFRYPLRLATTAHTCATFGNQIREHHKASAAATALGRLAARTLPFCSDTLPQQLWQPSQGSPVIN